MTSHRLKDGSWAVCSAPEACRKIFHVELSPAEAEAVPLVMMLPLFEAVQPPIRGRGRSDEAKAWMILEKLREETSYRTHLHREYDLPARIYPSGEMEWWWLGQQHRVGDKPAVVTAAGDMEWWEHGELVRSSGGPNQVDADGEQRWVVQKNVYGRELHREGGPALIMPDGSEDWYLHGKPHRDGGEPAYIGADGSKAWFVNGQPHRQGGPAKVYGDGEEEWWLHGKQLEPSMVELYKAEIRSKGGSW